MTREIARDIERKVVETVQDTMKRELGIAQHVLDSAEMALLLMTIAKGTAMTAAATIAGMANDREATFDAMIDALVEQIRREKPTAMRQIEEKYAGLAA